MQALTDCCNCGQFCAKAYQITAEELATSSEMRVNVMFVQQSGAVLTLQRPCAKANIEQQC